MTRDDFVKRFNVGAKIKADYWNYGKWVEILYIGSQRFFAKDNDGEECSWSFDSFDWLPYPESPKPKKTVKMAQALLKDEWNNKISPTMSGHFFRNKEDAEKYALNFNFILIQWPLVINEVEQWIEVEVEE